MEILWEYLLTLEIVELVDKLRSKVRDNSLMVVFLRAFEVANDLMLENWVDAVLFKEAV